MYQRAANDRRFADNQVADYGRANANVSYAWVARYTVGFLDAYLKDDASAMTFLKSAPAENGVPKHFCLRISARHNRCLDPIPAQKRPHSMQPGRTSHRNATHH